MFQSEQSHTNHSVVQAVHNHDPLGSPYPIPWNWMMKIQTDSSSHSHQDTRYYRTPALVSPDGQYATYSRIKMQATEELSTSRANSIMFVENLQTRELRVINATSPLADNPLECNESADQPGVIAILIPISWSADSDRVLARQFEGLFSSSAASDFAVIWHRQDNRVITLAPSPEIAYTTAILLGWSHTQPDTVLFQAGVIGDEAWQTWAVRADGTTFSIDAEQPQVYGCAVNPIWSGPQAH